MTSRRGLMSRPGSAAMEASRESFSKLFASVEDPQTRYNHARHLALTKNILYENELGWKVADLPLVSDFLQLLRNKVHDGVPQFTEQLVVAVSRCCKPFVRQKANEEVTNPSLLYLLLPTLGNLLSFNDMDVQVAAAEALRVFATGACLARPTTKARGNNADNKDDQRLTPRNFSLNLMEESRTVDAIVAVMHELFPDDGVEEQPSSHSEELEPILVENEPRFEGNRNEATAEVQLLESQYNERLGGFTNYAGSNSGDITSRSASMETSRSEQSFKAPIPVKKPSSAPPTSRNGISKHAGDDKSEDDPAEAFDTGNPSTLPEQPQVSARASKPSSAPTQRSNNVGSDTSQPERSNSASYTVSYERNIAAAVDETLSDELPANPAEDATIDDATAVQEEVPMPVIDAPIPVQTRLSMLVFPLIDLLNELSSSQRCAEVLVVSGALHFVVFLLESIINPQDELLPLCLEILWSVLELSHEKVSSIAKCASRKELLETFRLRNATFFLGSEFTFYALLHILELLLAKGYRQQDKETRNECLMILQLLAKRRQNLNFFYSTGLTACLLSYATSAELSHAKSPKKTSGQQDKASATASAITASNQYYATNSDEDFEFKQMLWFLLAEICCDHQANLSELVQFRFLEVWLSYATTKGSDNQHQNLVAPPRSSANRYSAPQLQVLQTTALSALNHVAPSVAEHFYDIGGHTKLLEYLQFNLGNEDVLASAWLLMLQVSPALPFFQAELGKLGVVETAVEVFEAPASRHTFAIRRNAILTCANMCRNDDGSNRKRFLRANGVHTLVQHLEFDPSHSVLEENIIVGIVDAVRSCVVGHTDCETAFINDGGVSRLLSILGVAPKALKHQVLAALAEICVNPAAMPSYQSWRCDQPGEKNNCSANQVLLRIYADEEAAEKRSNQDAVDNATTESTSMRHSAFQSVTNCQSPFIVAADISGPEVASPSPSPRPESPAFARLKEALKAAQSLATEKQPTLSILQLEDHPELNLKAKVYSVLENVSVSCEAEKLTPQEQVMLEVAKEYPTFRIGEMWQNVECALHAEGVRPIYADSLYIRKKIEHAYNISVCTKLAQQEVFARSHQQTTELESAFFKQILLQKHQEAQAEQFHRANRRQNSTMQLHLDAKKTRLEFMRRQDPTAFAAHESEERCKIRDPPPEYVDEQEGWQRLQQNEAELRGRLTTIPRSRQHSV